MDIKRAKQEIEHAVKAYLAVDDTGTPLIPPIRQRPILLMGPPGVGKTQIMEQIAPTTPAKAPWACHLSATAILAARTAA